VCSAWNVPAAAVEGTVGWAEKMNSAASSGSPPGGGGGKCCVDVCSPVCTLSADGLRKMARCRRQRCRFQRCPLRSTTQLPLTLATSCGSEYTGASLWPRLGRRIRTQSPAVNNVGVARVRRSCARAACCCRKRTRFSRQL
jgi:hypothetical protein